MPLNDAANRAWTCQSSNNPANATATITATAANDSHLTFGSAEATTNLIPGSGVILSGGAAKEVVVVSSSFVPGSSATVPLSTNVVNASQTTVTFSESLGFSYSDPPTTAFLSSELPTASVQQTWFGAAATANWMAASGNPANVPSIASKTLAAPTLTMSTTDVAQSPNTWLVWLRPVVGGYPLPTLSYAWGDGSIDTRGEAPYAMNHTYAADGAYTVTVTASSTQGTATATRTATITNGTTVWS